MKKQFAYFFTLIICLCNCTNNDKNFELIGKIDGQDTGSIVLVRLTDSIALYDTSKIINGEFYFEGITEEPVRARLDAGNELNRAQMHIEPGKMEVILAKDKFKDFKLKGSKTQDESEFLYKAEHYLIEIIDSLQHEHSKNIDFINTSTDKEYTNEIIMRNEELDKQIAKYYQDKYKIDNEFVTSHPNSYLSPFIIFDLHQGNYLPLDSVKKEFSNLTVTIQKSKRGQFLSKFIRTQENIKVGSIAKDFKALDINNQPLTLSQFRNKNVVLIEFWASWCSPCRSSFAFLKNMYKKYYNSGFKIIAISIQDTDKETWISAIKQDSINNWFHLATTFIRDKPINEEILQDYPLGPIPLTLLIDKQGKIAASWTGYYPENEKDFEEKLIEVLNTNSK